MSEVKKRMNDFYGRFLMWRLRHIRNRDFLLILSMLVGIASGFAAVLMKNMIHYTHSFFTEKLQVDAGSIWFFILPFFGILLTWIFIKFFVRDEISHGVTKVLYAISRQNSIIKSHNNYSSIVASSITIGMGGSVGAEATIVLTGASIGSNLARFFKMNYKAMTLMVGCGAAAAVSGIFQAPVAGIMFTLEILLLDLTMASLIPLMISAISAYVVVYFLVGEAATFDFVVEHSFILSNIPYYILLGVGCGLISVYFIRMNLRIEGFLRKINHPLKRILIGGACLGVLIFVFPSLYGEGYNTLNNLLKGNPDKLFYSTYFFDFKDNIFVFLSYIGVLIFIKVFATAFTNGSGGVGGTFAPSLFTGGVAGFFMATFLNYSGLVQLPVSYFVLAGMAGLMSGVMNAPLTAMFLIAEIAGGYDILLPLMITSVVAYITSWGMEPHSIYARRLALTGELITHNKDKAVLTLMKLDKVIETDFKTVNIDATLGDMVKAVSRSSRNIFPVIDEERTLLGIVLLDDIRKVMFNHEMYTEAYVRDFMTLPPVVVDAEDTMDSVMEKFEDTGAWNLPVIENGKYMGFVSKSKIFNTYRRVLQHFSDE